MRRQRSAFTLIEVLIVGALLAILAAASLGPIVAPLREQQFAEAEASGIGAMERLVPVLVEDAHAAVSFDVSRGGETFILSRRSGEVAAAYRLGDDGILRRGLLAAGQFAPVLEGAPLPASAAPLADGVQGVSVSRMADGRLRVTLAASRETHARRLNFDNDIIVRLGQPGGNGARP